MTTEAAKKQVDAEQEVIAERDAREARRILGTLHADMFPKAHEEARKEAASALLNDVLRVAKDSGFFVKDFGIRVEDGSPGKWIFLRISSEHALVFTATDGLDGKTEHECSGLEYDPSTKQWVGAQSGERRSALIVAAEALRQIGNINTLVNALSK